MDYLLLVLIASLFGLTNHAAASLDGSLFIDDDENLTMRAGAASSWEWMFMDSQTGHPPHHFHQMHQKEMHLVLIKSDLSHFAHLHPTYHQHSHMSFSLSLNQPSSDPDNFALSAAIPRAGNYFAFSEVMPMDMDMMLFSWDITATGDPEPEQELILDPMDENGTITKYFDENDTATSPLLANYKLVLKTEQLEHCGSSLPKLKFKLFYRESGQAEFLPVKDLETWLNSYGHALVIGQKGKLAKEKTIIHLHAVWPLAEQPPGPVLSGPNIELAAHSHANGAPEDNYKAWLQIKHKGKVRTLAFIFHWTPESAARLRNCILSR